MDEVDRRHLPSRFNTLSIVSIWARLVAEYCSRELQSAEILLAHCARTILLVVR